jgi:hypothetical protein
MSRLDQMLNGPLAPGGQPGPGIDLQVFADLSLQLGRVATELESQRLRQQRFATALHTIDVVCPPITAATSTLDVIDLMGPRQGKVWDIRRISVATFTGGTVTVYKGAAADMNQQFTFLQAGNWGPDFLMLQPGDRLVMVSNAAFTGSATVSFSGVELDSWLLPDYLL